MDMETITFVTGNINKLNEVKAILIGETGRGLNIVNKKLDLPELQGEPEFVAREKCRLASIEVEGPVLSEDTSLCFNALGGLPGVYIKWFVAKIGLTGLNNLLEAYEDKSAYVQCIFAYSPGPNAQPILFVGRCNGTIIKQRGENGFGFDAIFLPDGETETFAELPSSRKNIISHRAIALQKVKEFLHNMNKK
tara:strand:+ start:840 stop:1418 length:579 start_codon:yes stop_codon:yes gene_type:complete